MIGCIEVQDICPGTRRYCFQKFCNRGFYNPLSLVHSIFDWAEAAAFGQNKG